MKWRWLIGGVDGVEAGAEAGKLVEKEGQGLEWWWMVEVASELGGCLQEILARRDMGTGRER